MKVFNFEASYEFVRLSDYWHYWLLPSVLWCCLLGIRRSMWPVKNWVMRCWHGYLSGARCKWFVYGPADTTAIPSSLLN